MRRVESAAAETSVVGDSESKPTKEVCPDKVCKAAPVLRDHIRTVPSIDPEQVWPRKWSITTLYTNEERYSQKAAPFNKLVSLPFCVCPDNVHLHFPVTRSHTLTVVS